MSFAKLEVAFCEIRNVYIDSNLMATPMIVSCFDAETLFARFEIGSCQSSMFLFFRLLFVFGMRVSKTGELPSGVIV